MLTGKLKVIGLLISTVLVPATVAGSIYFASSNSMKMSKASGYTLVLNNSNSPEISGGNATRVDNKNVTWEYHNVADFNDGHVTLNGSSGNESYFGVSSSSEYGYTQIEGITVTFSGGELYLLKSLDGVDWHESEFLKSDEVTHDADNWRYIRFYSHASIVNITSVSFGYNCAGISITEDSDSAKYENVIATTSNLTYARDYINISPNSVGGEAVTFTKSGKDSSTITLGFNREYKLIELQDKAVEFDLKATTVDYGKTVMLVGANNYTSANANSKDYPSCYKFTNIQDDWYHVEVPVNCLVSLISGYANKDPASERLKTQVIYGVKINQGNCTVDNLRISTKPCDLGNYNGLTYKPKVNEYYWLKIAHVGHLYGCTITFSDDTIGVQVPLSDPNLVHQSPFYIHWLTAGTVTVTARVECGYNHRILTLTKTITIQ